jgi:hypothetical protein
MLGVGEGVVEVDDVGVADVAHDVYLALKQNLFLFVHFLSG